MFKSLFCLGNRITITKTSNTLVPSLMFIIVTKNEKIARLYIIIENACFSYIIVKTQKRKHYKYNICNMYNNALFRKHEKKQYQINVFL